VDPKEVAKKKFEM
jgi:hypothetical protein